MKSDFSAATPNCATCAYWTGQRRFLDSSKALVEAHYYGGDCSLENYNNETPAHFSCSRYVRWGAMRDR